jgi:hypothetical protein
MNACLRIWGDFDPRTILSNAQWKVSECPFWLPVVPATLAAKQSLS